MRALVLVVCLVMAGCAAKTTTRSEVRTEFNAGFVETARDMAKDIPWVKYCYGYDYDTFEARYGDACSRAWGEVDALFPFNLTEKEAGEYLRSFRHYAAMAYVLDNRDKFRTTGLTPVQKQNCEALQAELAELDRRVQAGRAGGN